MILCNNTFHQNTNVPLLLQSLLDSLGAAVFSPHQAVLLHIHWCWSCKNQPLWHVDISDHQGDLPKPGCYFPFWKNFSVSQINWTNPPNRRWRPDAVSDLACIGAGWRHLNIKDSLRLQSGRLCVDWCFCVVCVRVQCSLGSSVEPQSARAPSLRAGDAPN